MTTTATEPKKPTETPKGQMTPLQQKYATTRDLLEKSKASLAMALPKQLTADRMVRVVLTECLASVQRARPGTPTLLDCTRESFMGAVIQCAQLGLEPGVLGQAYLIPFRNNKRNTVEVQLIPGYKGLIDLARRSGRIRSIDPVVVYAKDKFKPRRGTNPGIDHVPHEGPEKGDAVAYYAIAFFKDGGFQFEYMWRADVVAHRDRYSKAYSDGPWVTNFDEMGLKTVLRKLCKFLPLSPEAQVAVALDERAEQGIPQDLAALADGSWGTLESVGDATPESAPAAPTKLDKLAETLKGSAPPGTIITKTERVIVAGDGHTTTDAEAETGGEPVAEVNPTTPAPVVAPQPQTKPAPSKKASPTAAGLSQSQTTLKTLIDTADGLETLEAVEAFELEAWEPDGRAMAMTPADRTTFTKHLATLKSQKSAA